MFIQVESTTAGKCNSTFNIIMDVAAEQSVAFRVGQVGFVSLGRQVGVSAWAGMGMAVPPRASTLRLGA